MLPLAPVLLSTFMPWPVLAAIFWATMRPTTSTAEPAANGLIQVTGRAGQSEVCACAASGASSASSAVRLRRRDKALGVIVKGILQVSLVMKFRGLMSER